MTCLHSKTDARVHQYRWQRDIMLHRLKSSPLWARISQDRRRVLSDLVKIIIICNLSRCWESSTEVARGPVHHP